MENSFFLDGVGVSFDESNQKYLPWVPSIETENNRPDCRRITSSIGGLVRVSSGSSGRILPR